MMTFINTKPFHSGTTNRVGELEGGNTVEISVEQAQYGKAAADYQATLNFLENRISGIRKALKGE